MGICIGTIRRFMGGCWVEVPGLRGIYMIKRNQYYQVIQKYVRMEDGDWDAVALKRTEGIWVLGGSSPERKG